MTKEQHDTLVFIESRLKEVNSKYVTIPMEDFPWYDERNNQLTTLFYMGYITKPLFYDNSAQIQLTAKGRDYLNNLNQEYRTKPTVFISYNWGSTVLVDEIEMRIKPYAIVKRDKNNVKHWGSLVEFMKSIREQDFAVLIISDDYLKSPACMYEVLQLMKDESWMERSMFVVTDDTKIYDTIEQLKYISFWNNKYKELDEALSAYSRSETVPQAEELSKYEYIKKEISEFMRQVSSVLNPKKDEAIDAIISRLTESSSCART